MSDYGRSGEYGGLRDCAIFDDINRAKFYDLFPSTIWQLDHWQHECHCDIEEHEEAILLGDVFLGILDP